MTNENPQGSALEISPELLAELLDPESWDKVLETYSRTMRVAVALTDTKGQLIGACHNPQPVWSLAHDSRPGWGMDCLFCLAPHLPCTAVYDVFRTGQQVLVHDQAGLAHVALPLSLGDRNVGVLLAGQVFDRYPEILPLQRVARDLNLPAQELWQLARKQIPISRASLQVYGDLLATLGQAFLRQRFAAILERKLAETHLQVRDYAEAVVETVQQPLVILSEDLIVLSANRAFYEDFEVSKEETEGRHIYEIGNEQWQIPGLRELLEKVIPEQSEFQAFEVEHNFEHIGRKIMLLSARGIFKTEPYGRTVLLAIEDITARRRAEVQLLRSNTDLQRFGSVISHDLQEPLRTIGSFTQLLAKRYTGKLDSDADEFIHFVQDGVVRMKAMIRDLLLYAKATDSEEYPLEATSAELSLQESLANLQTAIEESGASISYEPLPTVPYHPHQLGQVFQNLVGNAIKYRREELLQVRVSAVNKQGEWLFSVADNGIGFEPAQAENIFGVFKRLHGARYEGTGIGLATCRRIVEHYGGRIWAESVPGTGSTFYFTIPG